LHFSSILVAVKGLKGVKKITINLLFESAEVEYDSNYLCENTILHVINEIGYRAETTESKLLAEYDKISRSKTKSVYMM